MKLRNLFFAVIAAFSTFGAAQPAFAQSTNPFNPDFAWCATQGAVATRKANTWGCLTPGTAGQVLRTNGASADVSWQTVTGTGTVTSVGLAMPSFITVTGSPVTTTGTLTGTLASQSANQLFIAPNGSAGAPTFRSMVAADLPNAGVVTGSVITGTWPALTIGATQVTNGMLASNAVTAAKVANNTLTNGTLQQMATMTVKSNITGGTANAADNTVNAVLGAQLGTTQGNVPFRGASAWGSLSPVSGGILQSNGSGADPSWVTTAPANFVNSAAIQDNAVSTTEIADNSITASKIAGGATGASWVLVGSNSATGAATIGVNGVFSPIYTSYKIIITNLVPSLNASNVGVQTGSGGSFNTTSNYQTGATITNLSGTTSTYSSGLTVGFIIAQSSDNIAANNGINAELTLNNPSGTSNYKTVTIQSQYSGSSGTFGIYNAAGVYNLNTNAVTDIRIVPQSGTLTGSIYVYGLRPN